MSRILLLVLVLLFGLSSLVDAQKSKKPVKAKADILTLRYKPQAGTLLYNVLTNVTQRVRTDLSEQSGTLTSTGQLAYHNVAIDYKTNTWSFDRYFTKFQIAGHELNGDSLVLHEEDAVNKITRLSYKMTGEEIKSTVVDSMKLLNAEAQTLFYFFQPPRMLVPLPVKPVTYGNTWVEHRIDTIVVKDTINIGITQGSYIYDVSRQYQLGKLLDTLGNYLAIIVAVDSGSFRGEQGNTVTNISYTSTGKISGADTTFLDLFSGRVLRRASHMEIPAKVEVASQVFSDFIDVYSVVVLDETNALKITGP